MSVENTFCNCRVSNKIFYSILNLMLPWQPNKKVTGTQFAPVYATVTIRYLEVTRFENVAEVFGDEFGKYFITIWKQFLDDCFITW